METIVKQKDCAEENSEFYRKLKSYQGTIKPKSNISEEEAGERAFRRIAKRLGVNLD